MDLFSSFVALSPGQSSADFTAIDLSVERRDFLGKAIDGSPVFLLHDASAAAYAPSINLRSVSVQFHCTCRVTTVGGTLEDQFAVVSCDASVPELYEVFIRCFSAVVEQLPVAATTVELQYCIQALLNLFGALSQPGRREVAGLWAELFVISRCDNVTRALHAWHADPFERFDFAWPNGRMEVKAAMKEQRIHEFALEQLQQPVAGAGFLASVLLQPLSGGIGITDLANAIESRLTEPKLRQKLWENIALALGNEFSQRVDRSFDPSFAQRTLTIYKMSDIPTPEPPRDPRITGLRFQVDLSSVQSSLRDGHKSVLTGLFR